MIVALSGWKESGKSTVADYLVRTHKFRKLSFAAPLKAEVRRAGFCNVLAKPTPPHIRRLLQAWGQARRAEDPDYWIRLMDAELNQRSLFDEHFVIDDLRFLNEYNYLHGRGAHMIRIQRMNQRSEDTDISEHDLDDVPFDWHFGAVYGDINSLQKQMEFFMQEVAR